MGACIDAVADYVARPHVVAYLLPGAFSLQLSVVILAKEAQFQPFKKRGNVDPECRTMSHPCYLGRG